MPITEEPAFSASPAMLAEISSKIVIAVVSWLANTRERLAMLRRPGNAGSNTFTDHREVLAAALRQVPARFRKRILVRIDGAGASHELTGHPLSLSSPRKTVLFTCGWMITAADETAIMQLPQDAWKPGISQDGEAEQDKDVAEITHLMSRAGKWPAGLRWVVRRVKPSRRQMPNLAAYEKTGWRYSIICTNIPDNGITGVPGSHHPPRRRCPRLPAATVNAIPAASRGQRGRQGHGG
jgi:hypothetical protein